MPKVPTLDNFSVGLSSASGARFQAPTGPSAGAIAAEQGAQESKAISGAGAALTDITSRAMDLANQVRVNDAINQARIKMQDLAFNQQTGFMTKRGQSAFMNDDGTKYEIPLNEQYGEKFGTAIDEISNNLGNDRQKMLFAAHASDLKSSFNGQLQEHMLKQFNVFADATDDATIGLAGANSGTYWNDPSKIFGQPVTKKDDAGNDVTTYEGGFIDQARAAIYNKAKRAGLTGAALDEALLKGTSSIHEKVIQAALQNNNPEYALNYADRVKKAGQMHPDDMLKLQGHINTAMDTQLAAKAVGDQSTDAAPKFAPTALDRFNAITGMDDMLRITAKTESGNRDYDAKGNLITSAKGAQGKMQTMPGTQKDPGYGVKPAQDDSVEEKNRVGRDYLGAMLKRYGDPALAWAAYNAGPGTLDQALKDARASRGGERTWLAYMPKETQDYVTKNMAQLTNPAQVITPPTESEFVNGALARLPAGSSAQAIKFTTEQAKSKFEMLTKSIKEQGEAAEANAQRWIIANKGAPIESMPPALVDKLNQFAPGKMDDLKKFATSLSKDDVQTNPALYMKLTDDAYLKGLTDDQFFATRKALSESDFKKFADHRQTLTSGAGSNGWGELNTQAINTAFQTRLRLLKMDPTPKEESSDAVRVGGMMKFIRDTVMEEQRQAGKKFNDVETTQSIDRIFGTNAKFRSTFLGFSGSSEPMSIMEAQVGNISEQTRKMIEQDLKSKGRPVNDENVLGAWRALQLAQNRKAK